MMVIPDSAIRFIRYQRTRYALDRHPDEARMKEAYIADVQQNFAQLLPHLPANVASIIEIGCGVGGFNVLLQRHYPEATVTLLDGDKVTREGGAGYSKNPDIYNSRAVTEEFLKANGCRVDRWLDVGTKNKLKADLIVSLYSWGYHYPLATYHARGTVIADLRIGKESKRGTVILQGPKYFRCMFRMKGLPI